MTRRCTSMPTTPNKKAPRRKKLCRMARAMGITVLAAMAAMVEAAVAETYPSRPVTMIVPYAAGGPTDTLARLISEPMQKVLGQTVIIENVAGGAGVAATTRAASAKPDGYTVIIGNWGTHVINGARDDFKLNVLRDFEPVGLVADNPHLIVSRADLPAKSLPELIAWVRANPDKATAANSGIGSPSHYSGLQFQSLTKTKFAFVTYRGSGPALIDLMAGKIDLYFDQISNSLQAVKGGKLKAYAVAAPKRSTAAPDIPTVDEAGLPGMHISVWHAVWAPKDTPKDAIAKLNAAFVAALDDTATRQRLADLGQDMFPPDQRTPSALAAFHKAQIEKWWPIIKAEKLAAQ